MKLVKFLAAVLMAGFLSSHVTAQVNVTGTMVSPNLVNINNQQGGWTGTTSYSGTGGGVSGGSTPGYNSTTNTLYFGYQTKTAAYTYAFSQALQNSGMTILGYNYAWEYLNQNPYNGTLSAAVNFAGVDGSSLHNKTWTLGTTTDWTKISGTENFGTSGLAVASIANFSLSFTGKDQRFWAGYYGPQVKDPSITLNYTFDQCSSNPLSSPSCPGYAAAYLTQQCTNNPLYSSACAGFTDILTSQNILATSYAINQALGLSGSGVKIHGFKYGYDYVLGGTWCSVAGQNTDGTLGCSKWDPSSIDVGVAVTDINSNILYSKVHSHTDQNTSGSTNFTYLFPTTQLLSNMGGFAMVDQVNGTGAVFNQWSNWQYTPDPCVVNPLSSTSCSGYAAAYKLQQCTANPLSATDCPGYAEAFKTQQCTANVLYDPTCPGYAAAYLTYQCSVNPLYSTTCAGYEQAYLNAQCIKDSLYSTKCEGYATAYAIKYLTPISSDSTVSTAVNGSLSSTAAIKASDPTNTVVATNTASTTVSTDGTVSTGVSKTGDTNVDKAITPTTTTANSSAAPAAPVQLAPPPPPTAGPQQAQGEGGRKQEQRAEKKEEPSGERPARKEDGPAGGTQMAQAPQGGDSKPSQQTNREALVERRQAAARAEAVERGKNLANEMGKVADMESQKQMQNVVIQAMGFTPGFDVYGKATLPDGNGYRPFTVYNNQKNIENRATLRMFSGTDRLHNEMVDSQYKEK